MISSESGRKKATRISARVSKHTGELYRSSILTPFGSGSAKQQQTPLETITCFSKAVNLKEDWFPFFLILVAVVGFSFLAIPALVMTIQKARLSIPFEVLPWYVTLMPFAVWLLLFAILICAKVKVNGVLHDNIDGVGSCQTLLASRCFLMTMMICLYLATGVIIIVALKFDGLLVR